MSGAELGQIMFGTVKYAAIAAAVLAMSAAVAASTPQQTLPEIGVLPDASPVTAPAKHARNTVAAAAASCVNTGSLSARVCGMEGRNNTYQYLGIPYATASRWAAPRLSAANAPEATSYGSPCPQVTKDRITGQPVVVGSETCLFLNIWTPQSAIHGPHALPVLVFIHGGAFVSGSGGENSDAAQVYDGSALAARSAVVVTINYRLGAEGFLVANDKGVVSAGNFGLQDQQTALRWVSSYIHHFGGNAMNVTIFGESAGAMSVGLHLFDAPASGLYFQKAIMESNPLAGYYQPNDRAQIIGNEYIDYLCDAWKNHPGNTCTGRWQSSVPIEMIVAAQDAFLNAPHDIATRQTNQQYDADQHLIGLRSLTWQPSVDGSVVWGEPYLGYAPDGSGGRRLPGKPFIVGMNRDEGVAFAAKTASEILPNAPNLMPTQDLYGLVLDNSFGPANHIADNDRYNDKAAGGHTYSYYSAYGQALANVIGDFSFVCGADETARAAVAQYPDKPVFAYYFSQPPTFDLFDPTNLGPADGPCKPLSGNVCHTDELPYVFETLRAVETNSGGAYHPRPDDDALARRVAGYWFAFANAATPAQWAAFTANAHNAEELVQPEAQRQVNLDSKGLCTSVWSKFYATPPRK